MPERDFLSEIANFVKNYGSTDALEKSVYGSANPTAEQMQAAADKYVKKPEDYISDEDLDLRERLKLEREMKAKERKKMMDDIYNAGFRAGDMFSPEDRKIMQQKSNDLGALRDQLMRERLQKQKAANP
jgi:hypothetical protein